MQFSIGAWTYDIRRRWNLKLDGEAVDGYAASTVRCIFLDGDLDPGAMLVTLRHEHAHAWEFEVGTPRDRESLASFAATVGAAFDKEFAEQGGAAALEAIAIEGTRPARRAPQAMNNMRYTDRIDCGVCGAPIMVGSIAKEEPRLVGETGMSVVPRGCQCPVCESVQTWDERCTAEGMPLGEYLNVRILHGSDKTKWVAAHLELHCPYQF